MNNSEENRVIEQFAIPKFLNRTMSIMPENVKITSIRNSGETTMEICVEAEEYEQLGYFLAAIKADGMLENIQSTTGTKSDSLVQITIEGDLKWEKIY